MDANIALPRRTFRWYDHLTVNINWFSLTLRSQVLAGLLVPLLVQGFVGESQKGSYFGAIRLWALMTALLAQSMFGLISDRSHLRRGRRRPFIFAGTLLEIVVILSIAWIAGLQGFTGYTVLLIAYILSMILNNMAQAGTQGLIPDVVPQEKRGLISGVKMLLEIPLPLRHRGTGHRAHGEPREPHFCRGRDRCRDGGLHGADHACA